MSCMDDSRLIRVRVTTKARQSRVESQADGSLRVYVSEAPERGWANDAARAAIAVFLGIPRIRVELVSGATNRDKTFRIHSA